MTLKHNGVNVPLSPNNLSYDDVKLLIVYLKLDSPLSLKSGDKLTLNLRAGTDGGSDFQHWSIGTSTTLVTGIASMSSKYSTSSNIPDKERPTGEGLMFTAYNVIEN